jgi:hypothetical protein
LETGSESFFKPVEYGFRAGLEQDVEKPCSQDGQKGAVLAGEERLGAMRGFVTAEPSGARGARSEQAQDPFGTTSAGCWQMGLSR